MNDYMRAIGFSSVDKQKLREIIQLIIDEPKVEYIADNGDGVIAEKSSEFAKRIGIIVRGEYLDEETFKEDYFFPYVSGDEVSIIEEVGVEKFADREAYIGVCDNVNIGLSLAFYLLNTVDYIDNTQFIKDEVTLKPLVLSALSISGKIILPIYQDAMDNDRRRSEKRTRDKLIYAARKGDEKAIESLTLEDIDLYTSVAKRARNEDVLSIVESYFMPHNMSCDEYSVLGNILEVDDVENSVTGEKMYILKLNCNDIVFDVCINKDDLLGEPMVGRRFKGVIWMQGKIEFMAL